MMLGVRTESVLCTGGAQKTHFKITAVVNSPLIYRSLDFLIYSCAASGGSKDEGIGRAATGA